MRDTWRDRSILITGGAGHIGAKLAQQIVASDGRVALLDRQATALESVAREIKQMASRDDAVLTFETDLLNERQTREACGDVADHFGTLDGLVHNAAFVGTSGLPGWTVPLEEQSAETWRSCLEVNLTVPFYVTQALLQPLRQSGSASVLMIGSIYGMSGPDHRLYEGTQMGFNPAAYGASKGGLLQLTRYLATTLAPKIRVNCLSLGGLFRSQPAAFVDRYVDRTPLRRMGTEEDVVGPAMFLLAPDSAYITGQNLVVDGGWTAW
ncbi:MAG: SDR family oxidoreductase [Planctomycetota bacterium]